MKNDNYKKTYRPKVLEISDVFSSPYYVKHIQYYVKKKLQFTLLYHAKKSRAFCQIVPITKLHKDITQTIF